MKRRRHPQKTDSRRGIILMVVLSLLTLFLVVGLSFVSYADSELQAAQNSRDGETAYVPDMEPEQAFAYAMKQLIYGVPNDATGVYSAVRGHELARGIYGYRDDQFADSSWADNSWAYSGIGRMHLQPSFLAGAGLPVDSLGQDDFYLINYTYWQVPNPGQPPGPNNMPILQVRDPERLGLRTTPQAPYAPNSFVGTANPPYTYPDLNNMLLAAVDSNGKVLAISGHRDYVFGSLDKSNPHWNDVEGKYLILCPRPSDNAVNGVTKFPYPEDAGGHVKNLIGGPGGNDSIWIDAGAPVQTLPDGRKYKMLIAPLIIDLDGRVNLNVHGNILGVNQTHASNQGWGKWEINLSKVLNADSATNPQEWQNVFVGIPPTAPNPQVYGRYGLNRVPNNPGSIPPGRSSPYYAMTDINGIKDLNATVGQPSDPIQVPTYPTSPPLSLFPSFLPLAPINPAGYNDGLANERLNHPLGYNFFLPGSDDRAFGPSHMEAILRYGDTNSPALTSDLYRLLPNNLGWGGSSQAPKPQLAAQIRRMITTHSFDVDRPGMSPYVYDPQAVKYQLAAGTPFPTGGPIPFPPPVSLARFPVPSGSDFDSATWRSLVTALGRIDLNRLYTNANLTDYPPPDPTTGRIDMTAGANQFAAAQGSRQQLALDIYTRLRLVTGAVSDPPSAPNPETPDFQAVRWLAQLAANIVDYIDDDDYSTPFNWYTDNSQTPPKKYWVFGTELPRVVLNEAYSEIANDPNDPNGKTDYVVNFWAELLNPFLNQQVRVLNPNSTPPLIDNGVARLQVPAAGTNAAYAVYQLAISTANANMRNAANVLGDPDLANIKTIVADFTPDLTAFTPPAGMDPNVILPVDGQYGDPATYNAQNKGFYVLGPKYDFPGAAEPAPAQQPLPSATNLVKDQQLTTGATAWQDQMVPTPFRSSMTYTLDATVTTVAGFPKSHALVLRRLACPGLPPDLNPASATYNPYITVDFVPAVATIDAVGFVNGVANTDPNYFKNPQDRFSQGRREPYAANQWQNQAPSAKFTLQPQNTFFRQNAVESFANSNNGNPNPTTAGQTLNIPFHWLAHMDRQLVSPMELLNVSAFKPSELTQQFVAGAPYQHLAPWFDQTARIYRAFELLETGDRAAGMSVGGRLAGKININTIWDARVWEALCDAQTSNNFTQADVDSILANLVSQRPFLGMAAGFTAADPAGQYPAGNGIENTLFASTTGKGQATDPRLLGVPNQAHPYQQAALMNKIFSNLTTRSNVFAVWITVGFFEVNDDTTRPVKLGAELGRAENRHVRHRMFAIVDRTNLVAYSTSSQGVTLDSTKATPQQFPVQLAAITGIDGRTGRRWQVTPGVTELVFDPNDPNGNEETVLAQQPGGVGPIVAMFNKSHAPGPVIVRGNPGPWTRYDPRQDNQVVPYFSIID